LKPGETAPKGTAVIRGRVVAGDSGAPIRRARVQAMSMDGRGGGVTSTNADGLYEIKELAAGRYSLFASKGGFVNVQFGQRLPATMGMPLELSDGQLAERVNFSLPRGGVIAGQITDESGDPVPATAVTAMRYMTVGGARRLTGGGVQGGNDQTDDQGNFRLFGLPPGDYVISATNRSGNFTQPDVVNTEAEAYAPTYYPGTMNLAEAVRVTVRAGQQLLGANFALIEARLARVRGRVLNSRGEAVARAMVAMVPADPAFMSMMSTMNNAMANPDGTFAMSGVAPGRYTLSVRPTGMNTTASTQEFASLAVVVGSDDLDDFVVTTSPRTAVRGAIVSDDGSPLPFRPDAVSVFANSTEPMAMMTIGNSAAKVNDDFTFEIPAVFERRIIRAFVQGSTGWYFKAAYLGSTDVTDTGIDFGSRKTVDDVQIVLTQKATDLSGFVLDERGKIVHDVSVILFPANRERWASFVNNRFLRTARPDQEGRYRIRSMPPDEPYLIVAVQGLQEGQATDPEFLARARQDARPVTLLEGETKVVDVKLSAIQP
jgi:protocatechuate 3,4-dioxygenase beta subunit